MQLISICRWYSHQNYVCIFKIFKSKLLYIIDNACHIQLNRFQHGRKDNFEDMLRRDSKKHGSQTTESTKSETTSQLEAGGGPAKSSAKTASSKSQQGRQEGGRRNKEVLRASHSSDVQQANLLKPPATTQVPRTSTRLRKRIQGGPPIEDVDVDVDEPIIHEPIIKSPFRAIRGEGNSFHGWRN